MPALRPLERIWSAAVSIDVTDDPTLVREMALAGCTGVFVGFESLADANLADARKKTPRTADYARRVAILHDHGIQVNGSFVLGFDHDRADVFARDGRMDRREPAGMRDLPHPDAVSRDAAVPADGGGGAAAAQELVAVRHGARRVSAQAHESRTARRGIRLVLPASVLAPLDLAAPAGGCARGHPLPGDVVSLQTLELALALADSPPADRPVWRPLVETTRRRHLKFRRRLEGRTVDRRPARAATVVSAGV